MIIYYHQCSDTAVIYFDDVRVPAKNIIGEEGGLIFFGGGEFQMFEEQMCFKQHQRTGRWVKFVDLSYCGISEEKTMMLDVGKNKL